jgi:aminoglycoside phosphotransferase (APT) family kinase protein
VELVRIIQATAEFGEELDALGRDWSVTSLIHHDVRFKNFMWTAPSPTGRMPRLKLIDWELACPGDPAWDIGSAMANYLSLWLGSIPVTDSSVTELSIELARCPLSGIQDAIRACWAAYVKQRRLDDDVVEVLLSAAVRFAAARLVQTAFEATQDAGSLATDVVLHLQVALNVLQRPRQAVVHLLGLP